MKILKNQTGSPIFITDVGISVPASPSTYTIPSGDYPLWASSNDIITYIGSGDIIVNDGSFDLGKADSIALLQGNFKQIDFIENLKDSDRLKVEVLQLGGAPTIQVSSNDQSTGYLEAKIVAESGATTVTVLNDGGDEDLQIGLPAVGTASTYGSASEVPVITTDSKGRVSNVTNTSINITSSQVSDFNEAAQDAVGNALVDSASVDFTYNDGGNSITASVLPAGVDHNSLANLTSGDPHTQYMNREANLSVSDNAITRWDGTTGRDIQTSLATIDDNGAIISPSFIRVGAASDTTNGNIRYESTNNELLGRGNSTWRNLSIVPSVTSATSDTSTTSGTYSTISSMTTTPVAGTYMCYFTCTAALGDDTSGDISFFVNGVEDTTCTRRLAINASGFASANYEVAVCIICEATVNGSEAIDIRFRENGGGTLTVGPRRLKIIPIAR